MSKRKWPSFLLVLGMAFSMAGCGDGAVQPAAPQELDTPQYSVSVQMGDISFENIPEEELHTAEGGAKVIPAKPAAKPEGAASSGGVSEGQAPERGTKTQPEQPETAPEGGITPDTVWEDDDTATYHAFTMPDKAMMDENGCIGVLSIPTIELNLKVYESEDTMEAMKHGGAHFKSTSCYDGNVGISAHNGGVPLEVSFANLKNVKKNDTLTYETALGTRSYQVTEIREIEETDWSYLSRTADNRVTMITCVAGQPSKRLMVQAVEAK